MTTTEGRPESAQWPWALVVGGATFVLAAAALSGLGLTWDETQYMGWIFHLEPWWELLWTEGPGAAFDRAVLDAAFAYDPFHHAHPPLPKLLAFFADRWLPEGWKFYVKMRLPLAALLATTVGLLFGLIARRRGRLAAAFAVLGVLAQPRLLAHSLVIAHDGSLACFMVIALLAAAEMVDDDEARWPRALLAVAVAGALFTKITGVLLAGPLLVAAVLFGRPRIVLYAGVGLAAAAVLQHLFHPPHVLLDQALLHSQPHISVFLFGEHHETAPWWWLWVMVAIVPPAGLLALALPGTWALAREARRREPRAVLLGSALVLWAVVLMLPFAPRHDGIRQAAFWFLTAGVSVGAFVAALVEELAPGARRAALIAMGTLLGTGLLHTATSYPYWLESFSGLVGGIRGAATRGFEVTYWLDTITPTVREELNARLPRGATLGESQSEHYVSLLVEQGLLRPDLVPREQAEWMLMQNRPTSFTDRHQALLSLRPVRRWTIDGVEVLRLVRVPPGFWEAFRAQTKAADEESAR